jgi:ABC-2 type transport system permease protein
MKVFYKNFMRYRFLLGELVKKGIKLKYRRSYLGILWTLLEPLLTTIVLTVIFGSLLGRGDQLYPVYILSGRLLYSFFSGGTNVAMKSIRTNASMIKKVYVPKYMYPLSSVIYNYIIFLISLVVLVMLSLFLGLLPTWRLVFAVIPLLIIFVLTIGVGMILSTMAVFFRDLEYLWSVALMLIMYASAIFYNVDDIVAKNPSRQLIFDLNPLYCVIAVFRAAVFGNPIHWTYVAYSTVFAVLSLIVGVYLFYKKQDKFILFI